MIIYCAHNIIVHARACIKLALLTIKKWREYLGRYQILCIHTYLDRISSLLSGQGQNDIRILVEAKEEEILFLPVKFFSSIESLFLLNKKMILSYYHIPKKYHEKYCILTVEVLRLIRL